MRILTLLAALGCASASAAPLFVENVDVLTQVENHGFHLAEQLGAKGADQLDRLSVESGGYRAVRGALAEDLKALESKVAGPTMAFSRRIFDARWLSSPKASFELAGITLRKDRLFRHPGSCGEIRLIYRLAYRDEALQTYTRLPMTLQLLRVLQGPCEALQWNPDSAEAVLKTLAASKFFDLELNLQSVRWPAGARPDMGGYAEYIMRAFEPHGDPWLAKALDNTLDVSRLNASPALKKELLAWLKDPVHVDEVDQGEAMIDPKFLAVKASSVAVHGLNRRANRVFSRVFSEGDFASLDFSKTKFVKSPKGYLRKLDELSCVGCHQSKSIAGFHFLGADRPGSLDFNRVKIPFSYHFLTDQRRRESFLPGGRFAQGFVDRPEFVRGARNERCYSGADKNFVAWTCAEGLKCEPIGSAVGEEYFGTCQQPAVGLTGEACYFGRITKSDDPTKDHEIQIREKRCDPSLGCLHPSDGYPGGLCFANYCVPSETRFCAALAVPGFNPCLAQNKPFKECLARFTAPIDAEFCSLTKPCRDDFICAEGYQGKGVCAPPYSLFQLRVDGHSKP